MMREIFSLSDVAGYAPEPNPETKNKDGRLVRAK